MTTTFLPGLKFAVCSACLPGALTCNVEFQPRSRLAAAVRSWLSLFSEEEPMQLKRAEQLLESAIFNSRWLMAPFYVGLVVSLVVVLVRFIAILYEFIIHAWTAGESDIILGVLSLIDISLIGNLILIIVFAGYENFVSRIDASSHPDWPDWMTKIGFSGTKQKLLASIVAISVIQVLKAFMNLGTVVDNIQLAWLVGIQFAFVLSTLLLVWSDRLGRFNGESD